MAETDKSTKHESLVSSNYRFTLFTKRFLPQKVYLVICIGDDGCNVELPPPLEMPRFISTPAGSLPASSWVY